MRAGASSTRARATIRFLKTAAVVVGALTIPATLLQGAAAAPSFATVPHFTVRLPIPPTATPVSNNTFHLTQRQTQRVIHPSLGPTTVWGYDDGTHGPSFPGPTIEVQKEEAVTVRYENQLPSTHLLPGVPSVRTLTHLHGGFNYGVDDGNPYATGDYAPGEIQTAHYPNQQHATTLWYHDHAESVTHWNVYTGLAGFYLIRDSDDTGEEPNPIGIPGGAYEIPIVIQDRTFDENGQLFYRQFGDTAVVNGAAFPFLNVEPRQYRFRFLDGSNARFYNLEITGGPLFHQIGSHGGLFDAPVTRERILISPAERADVIVDFKGFEGQTLVLRNLQAASIGLPEIMQFRVGTTVTHPGPQSIPTSLPGSLPSFSKPDRERYITLESTPGTFFPVMLDGLYFSEPATIHVPAGDVEDWFLIGLAGGTHPIHVHPPEFQVVSRQSFNRIAYQAALTAARAAGEPTPDPSESFTGSLPLQSDDYGFVDVVSVPQSQVVQIRSPFDVPFAEAEQKYVLHCHILEHEDNDMMRPFDTVEHPRGKH